MIRGPVLPQQRDGLWALIAGRLEAIERGLTLVLEAVDCSGGQLGPVEGLARDAAGAPVLVLVAVEGDVLLAARTLAAVEFLGRVGDGLVPAIPEAQLRPGAVGRVLVVGTETAAMTLRQVTRMPMPSLFVCCLEPFRIAGTERFAVRWLLAGGPATEASPVAPAIAIAPEFAVPADRSAAWARVLDRCERIDPDVHIDGDRYWRRITWRGHVLGEIRLIDGALHASCGGATPTQLEQEAELRTFTDQVLRRFTMAAGLSLAPTAGAGTDGSRREAACRHAGGDREVSGAEGSSRLRAALAAARLSPEEYCALGGPTSAVGGEVDGVAKADDSEQRVVAPGGPRSPPKRPD